MRVLRIDISSKVRRCCVSILTSHADDDEQANQLVRAEKRFKEFEESVAQTNDQYQRQVRGPSPFYLQACPECVLRAFEGVPFSRR